MRTTRLFEKTSMVVEVLVGLILTVVAIIRIAGCFISQGKGDGRGALVGIESLAVVATLILVGLVAARPHMV